MLGGKELSAPAPSILAPARGRFRPSPPPPTSSLPPPPFLVSFPTTPRCPRAARGPHRPTGGRTARTEATEMRRLAVAGKHCSARPKEPPLMVSPRAVACVLASHHCRACVVASRRVAARSCVLTNRCRPCVLASHEAGHEPWRAAARGWPGAARHRCHGGG